MRFSLFLVAAFLTVFGLSACSTDENVAASTRAHTEGQALMDLKRANNAGAIDGDEYEDQKEEILDRYDD